ncbi:MAG: biotin transporter BioY [Gracilibacteraceae bacterium]|nr:biotin transporter BioY [Gracilibacteraceae bacterium]
MSKNPPEAFNLRMTVYCALFTALIIIGSYISIPVPIGPVPIVLADFFIMTAGLFLGCKYGLVSVALYLGLGIIGLPVFAGGKAGLAAFFGPTGGFLAGYLLLVALVGWIAGKTRPAVLTHALALMAGTLLLYAAGIPWLKLVTGMAWGAALTAGLVPFIPGTIIKIIAVLAVARVLLPQFRQRSGFQQYPRESVSLSHRAPAADAAPQINKGD